MFHYVSRNGPGIPYPGQVDYQITVITVRARLFHVRSLINTVSSSILTQAQLRWNLSAAIF